MNGGFTENQILASIILGVAWIFGSMIGLSVLYETLGELSRLYIALYWIGSTIMCCGAMILLDHVIERIEKRRHR